MKPRIPYTKPAITEWEVRDATDAAANDHRPLMHTDKHIYLLLGADPEFLGLLTDGLRIAGPYDFEAIDVKALERRIDGVVLPEQPEEPIWAIEVQARRDPAIYAAGAFRRSDPEGDPGHAW
jgi:hypothetical protein